HRVQPRLIGRRETDAPELVLVGRELAPFRFRWQRHWGCPQPRIERCDQCMLLDPALQLPDAEAHEQRHHHQREDAEAEASPGRCPGHFGERSTNRPSAALWWNCSAIKSDLIARSGHSVTARVSGSHSTACTQNGGWYLTSVISAAVTTIAP